MIKRLFRCLLLAFAVVTAGGEAWAKNWNKEVNETANSDSNLLRCPSSGYKKACFGIFTFPDGRKYVGEWKDNKYDGQGTLTSPDGKKYVGEFKDGKSNGQGTFTSPNGDKYVGEWKDNEANGQGTFTLADGRKYVGEFKDNEYNGQGTFTHPNGNKYVGEFKDGKSNGQGTFTLPNGDKYVGEFKDNEYNGQGTYTFADGRKYVGEWKDGKNNGQGTFTLPNGGRYVGEFKDDKYNGQGTFTFPDGRKYVGEFKDNKYNGQGIFTLANGSVDREGIWKDNIFQYSKKLTTNSSVSQTASSANNTFNAPKSLESEPDGATVATWFQTGLKAFEIENYTLAFENWSKGAGLNDPPSIFSLGWLYANGKGVQKSPSMAVNFYKRAADLGHMPAKNNLADHYRYGLGVTKNYSKAFELYLEAAGAGLALSQNELAKMYNNGFGVEKNFAEAFKWAKKSADQGDAHGQSMTGYNYLMGWGVEKNDTEALRWVKLAANQGDEAAKANLAAMLFEGTGGPKDKRGAAYWCRQIVEFKNKKLEEICGQAIASNGTDTTSNSSLTANQNSFQADAANEILALERRKRQILEQQLAALKSQQEQRQQAISSDTQKPVIQITRSSSNGPQGTVRGRVTDNTGIAEVRVDGELVRVDGSGNFTQNTFVPVGGVAITVQATDLAGMTSSMSVRLERTATASSATLSFARLNPLVRKVAENKDALALIIGVDNYENTPARAIYADKDAQVFADYATEKLGIPANRIKTLVNNGAGERELLLSVRSWLSRASKQGKTDVYIFFAGHGLASDDGSKMYLLPYDGAPELLDKTAILRDELFADISAANPRSVTIFLDTCYSGTTRGTDMLIASRPIAIRALEQSVPDNFTVMTAAAGDQTARPLEEAKHGMFSYFLMKGMEGDADSNQDNKITAGELHQYVEQNVVQQSSGSQTPELQGDANRVLVQFQ